MDLTKGDEGASRSEPNVEVDEVTNIPVRIIVEAEGMDNAKAAGGSEDMDTDTVDSDLKSPTDVGDDEGEHMGVKPRYKSLLEPYPECFNKICKLTIRIGPVRLHNLGNGALQTFLNTAGRAFDFKFQELEWKTRRKHKKEKLGWVKIPFVCRTPHFLLIVTKQISNLKIGEREMSVELPDNFTEDLEVIREYDGRIKKLRTDHSLAQQKRRLFIRNIPADLTIEKVQTLYPEAASYVRYRKPVPGQDKGKALDVKLEFETAEAAEDFFEQHKDNVMFDDEPAVLAFPYQDLLARTKAKEEQNNLGVGVKVKVEFPPREKKKLNPAGPNGPMIDSITLQSRRLLIRDVGDNNTTEQMQSLFPEAKRHSFRRRKDKPVDLRLDFEFEELAKDFYEKKKDCLTIDGKLRKVCYPYLENQPKKKKAEEETPTANGASKGDKSSSLGKGAGQEKRKLPGQQQKADRLYPTKQARRGSFGSTSLGRGSYAQMQHQQRQIQEQQQMRQRMMLQQSSNLSNIGMGGVTFGAGAMNQGSQGWMNDNYQSGYGPPGRVGSSPYSVGNGQFSNHNQPETEDAMSMMASLKSTLANIEKKLVQDDGGGDRHRKGNKHQGSYGGEASNYSRNVGGAESTYSQNMDMSGYDQYSGTSSSSQNAGQSKYSQNAGQTRYSQNAGNSSYSQNAGQSSYSQNAAQSRYSQNAGQSSQNMGGVFSGTVYSQNQDSGTGSSFSENVRASNINQHSGGDNYGIGEQCGDNYSTRGNNYSQNVAGSGYSQMTKDSGSSFSQHRGGQSYNYY